MSEYSYQDMLKMQEDAAVRVREMKRRAALVMEEDNLRRDDNVKNVIPDEVRHISYPVEIDVKSETENKCNDSGSIRIDSDSILIMMILVLISCEEADLLTSLALLYLLL